MRLILVVFFVFHTVYLCNSQIIELGKISLKPFDKVSDVGLIQKTDSLLIFGSGKGISQRIDLKFDYSFETNSYYRIDFKDLNLQEGICPILHLSFYQILHILYFLIH